MPVPRRTARVLTISLILAPLIYVYVFYSAGHSDGFRFIDAELRKSAFVESEVGAVQKIRLSWLGPYRSSSTDENEVVRARLVVAGTRGERQIDVVARRTGANWKLESQDFTPGSKER